MDKVNPRPGSLVFIFPFNDPESAFCACKALEKARFKLTGTKGLLLRLRLNNPVINQWINQLSCFKVVHRDTAAYFLEQQL